jgi:hypothetical protein
VGQALVDGSTETPLYRGGYKRHGRDGQLGPNTSGSQFFIMHQDYALQPTFVLFGKVTSGIEVVDALAAGSDGAERRIGP